MFLASCNAQDSKWSAGDLLPYGPLPLYPSAQALNYGQAVFEGMKAQRSAKVRHDVLAVLRAGSCGGGRAAGAAGQAV